MYKSISIFNKQNSIRHQPIGERQVHLTKQLASEDKYHEYVKEIRIT